MGEYGLSDVIGVVLNYMEEARSYGYYYYYNNTAAFTRGPRDLIAGSRPSAGDDGNIGKRKAG
jgi:hypothetical protein